MPITNAQEKIDQLNREKERNKNQKAVIRHGKNYEDESAKFVMPKSTSTPAPTVTPQKKSGPRNGRAGASPLMTNDAAQSALDTLKRKNAADTLANGILSGQNMSAYQGNMYSPTATSKPTFRDAMADVYRMYQTDPEGASTVYSKLVEAQRDPSSPYYNPFTGVTNRAAQAMQDLGYDVSNIDDGTIPFK